MQPAVANGNPPPSPIFELMGFGIEAALPHAFPGSVCSRSCPAVLEAPFVADLATRSAALHLAKFASDLFDAAVAPNPPAIFHGDFRSLAQNDEATKTQARDVGELRHRGEYGTGVLLWQGAV